MEGIEENKTHDVNILSTSLLAATNPCEMVAGREAGKSGLFEVFRGELGAAPMLAECLLDLGCRVARRLGRDHKRI